MNEHITIPGFAYVPEFIGAVGEPKLIEMIDRGNWDTTLKRRTQHYGFRYDYRAKSINMRDVAPKMPMWATMIADRLHTLGWMPAMADQMIINEYKPGQGIAQHIDCQPCFGEVVCSVSLGSDCVMRFQRPVAAPDLDGMKLVLLQRRSLLVISSEARHDWTHGIQPFTKDVFRGDLFIRTRRISLTFRTVILS